MSPGSSRCAFLSLQIWSTNYQRFISQTIFTLFYGGRDFAPKCIIDGVNIQDWLQMHFVNAMVRLAGAIRDAGDLLDDCVIGWDSMNEPGEGLIGYEDVSKIPKSQALKLVLALGRYWFCRELTLRPGRDPRLQRSRACGSAWARP